MRDRSKNRNQCKKYREKNLDACRQKCREYYKRNKDKAVLRVRRYYFKRAYGDKWEEALALHILMAKTREEYHATYGKPAVRSHHALG
jgi:hypothetical protein